MVTPIGQYGFGMVISGVVRRVTSATPAARRAERRSSRLPRVGLRDRGVKISIHLRLRGCRFHRRTAPLAAAAKTARSPVVVDDFESGTLAGWTLDRRGNGNWFAYQDGRQAPDPKQSDSVPAVQYAEPRRGKFAAVSDTMGPGSRLIYRDISSMVR